MRSITIIFSLFLSLNSFAGRGLSAGEDSPQKSKSGMSAEVCNNNCYVKADAADRERSCTIAPDDCKKFVDRQLSNSPDKTRTSGTPEAE